ncbi:unnamed protein product [Adineta ricciae]|uniref:Reverse transcriptase domain-containing protein n=1 Tax=Adineta ricciae TaxID=249248 RepID=A0A816DZF6_ADIRI|nr:unnamed protein product [Adineta ricciae]
MMSTTDLSPPLAATQRSGLQLRNRKVAWPTVVSPGAGPTADDGVSTDKGEKNVTVGVQAVTPLTQQSEISSSGRIKGPRQGRGRASEVGRYLYRADRDHLLVENRRSLESVSGRLRSSGARDDSTVGVSATIEADLVRSNSPVDPPSSTVVADTREEKSGSKRGKKKNSNNRRNGSPPVNVNIVNNNNNNNNFINNNDGSGSDKDEGEGGEKTEIVLPEISEDDIQPDLGALFIRNLKKARKEGCDGFRKSLKKRKIDKPTWNQLSIGVYAGAMTVEMVANRSTVEIQRRTANWFKATSMEMDKLRKTIGKATAELGRRKSNVELAPTPRQVSNIRLLEKRYWKNIVGVKKDFQAHDQHLTDWKQSISKVSEGGRIGDDLTTEMWQEVIRNLKPWKASGPDGIQGFWWKSFPSANNYLYKLVYHHLTTGTPLPQGWIANGRTVLLYKAGSREDPSNFRPITCLNTCYKILTGYIAIYLSRYINERNILPIEQRALQKNVWGCTHALIVDQTVVADAFYQKQRPLSVAWIDYAKAFDSVPHKYILWVLEAMQVPSPLRALIKSLMSQWRVKYEVKAKRGKCIRSQFLKIKSGVLQGDSFSPLLFCLSMAPLSHALNHLGLRYETACGRKENLTLSLSHQFYMDDLKLYASSRENLKKLLNVVKAVSKAISMKINAQKCATAHFVPKWLKNSNKVSTTTDDGDIPTLDGGSHYKYLGIDQNMQEKGDVSWDRVAKKCLQKCKRLWTSDLTYRQKVVVYNTTIIPALTYVSANLIKVSGKYESQLAKGESFDKDIRKMLVTEKARYKANSKKQPSTPGHTYALEQT